MGDPGRLSDQPIPACTTPGFKDAYRRFAEGGWQGLQHPAEFGGQGLPKTIGAACIEIDNSANLSFALCPLLTMRSMAEGCRAAALVAAAAYDTAHAHPDAQVVLKRKTPGATAPRIG